MADTDATSQGFRRQFFLKFSDFADRAAQTDRSILLYNRDAGGVIAAVFETP
jgi:hypothetical protein